MNIIISLIVLVTSFLLFKKASGTMKITQLNMHYLIFYWQLFLMCFIGVNLALYGLDNHYIISYKVKNYSTKVITYFSVLYVMIVLPMTMVFINFILKFNPSKEYRIYQEKEIKSVLSPKDNPIFLTILFLTFICFFSIVYTFYTIGTIPIIRAFSGATSYELAYLRQQSSRGFEGVQYIKNIFGLLFTPILSYITYVYKNKYKDTKWTLLFWILVVLSIFIVTYDLSKAPLLTYFIGFLILRILIKGKIRKITIAISSVFIIITIIVMYVFLYNYADLSNFTKLNEGPLGRIIFSQIAGLYLHFEYFPSIVPFLNGKSLPNSITQLFGIESIRSARVVMALANPRGIEDGFAGVMNTLFIGEAYANFGWLGMFFSVIYVGIVIQVIHILFIKYLPKNPMTMGIFAYLSILIPQIITGGFIDFLYNPAIICIMILSVIIIIISKTLYKPVVSVESHRSTVRTTKV